MDDPANDSDASMTSRNRMTPDWGRYGLSDEQQRESNGVGAGGGGVGNNDDDVFEHHTTEHNELFREDSVSYFFLSQM